MNHTEARQLLAIELGRWRGRTYQELAGLIGESHHVDVTGASGVVYQLEVEVFWDADAGGDIRVMGSVDDRGWRAFAPLTESFILSPAGEFVGE